VFRPQDYDMKSMSYDAPVPSDRPLKNLRYIDLAVYVRPWRVSIGTVSVYVKQFICIFRGLLLTAALCDGPFSRGSIYCQSRPSAAIFV